MMVDNLKKEEDQEKTQITMQHVYEATIWVLWIERNNRIFNRKALTVSIT